MLSRESYRSFLSRQLLALSYILVLCYASIRMLHVQQAKRKAQESCGSSEQELAHLGGADAKSKSYLAR